jgi:hypothetical protein
MSELATALPEPEDIKHLSHAEKINLVMDLLQLPSFYHYLCSLVPDPMAVRLLAAWALAHPPADA